MLFDGQCLKLNALDDGLYELCFDLAGERINKFNQATLAELGQALDLLYKADNLRGLLLSSAKSCFVVGADITEFLSMFTLSEEKMAARILDVDALFSRLEDLPCPTVVAINGEALGGGFEVCLACDYRVMSHKAVVGLPEVKLGILPGWGGTVRLPRLIGVDNAVEWICGSGMKKSTVALKDGAVDAAVSPDDLRDAALDLLQQCANGVFDVAARRREKQSPLQLPNIERTMAFESARGVVGTKAGPHYPAPMKVIKTIETHAPLPRDEALKVEAAAIASLGKTEVAESLVGIFLKDQMVKKAAKQYRGEAQSPQRAAVLGAGIMGGGIAYQSASKGVPIVMKDIAPEALTLGLDEADKLFMKQVKRGKLTPEKVASALHAIQPALSYGEFGAVDLVVEAVVENPKVKSSVLSELENHVGDDTVIATNTSTISISQLAKSLKRPERFCGMHFFNPVHRMPLVEVIRGEQSSEAAIGATVAYAQKLGKTPIVVNDCPGFFVNRVLFPYFGGFNQLLADGADFQRIDKLMERFGWPMGPAYLLDVVGLDTAHHAGEVMAAGFPERMGALPEGGSTLVYRADRLGQKNQLGFYRYELDKKGKPKKLADASVAEILAPAVQRELTLSDEQIIHRMMIPLCIEVVLCLQEGIVASAAEADMALIYGIGFPPFRGGALHYMDKMGLANFVALADEYAELGPLYHVPQSLRDKAAAGDRFFPQSA